MDNENLLERIEINKSILQGKPIIRGYRVSVQQILAMLAKGNTEAEVLKEFPFLEHKDILACLEYSAQLLDDTKIFKIAVWNSCVTSTLE